MKADEEKYLRDRLSFLHGKFHQLMDEKTFNRVIDIAKDFSKDQLIEKANEIKKLMRKTKNLTGYSYGYNEALKKVEQFLKEDERE